MGTERFLWQADHKSPKPTAEMKPNSQERPEEFRIASAPDTIDTEQLMREVRAKVAEKRRANIYGDEAFEPWAAFVQPGDPGLAMEHRLAYLEGCGKIDLTGEAIKSHRPILGRFLIAIKKFTRYWVRKYTDALFMRQAHFNSEAAGALKAMNEEVQFLRREVEELRAAKRDGEHPPQRAGSAGEF